MSTAVSVTTSRFITTVSMALLCIAVMVSMVKTVLYSYNGPHEIDGCHDDCYYHKTGGFHVKNGLCS